MVTPQERVEHNCSKVSTHHLALEPSVEQETKITYSKQLNLSL